MRVCVFLKGKQKWQPEWEESMKKRRLFYIVCGLLHCCCLWCLMNPLTDFLLALKYNKVVSYNSVAIVHVRNKERYWSMNELIFFFFCYYFYRYCCWTGSVRIKIHDMWFMGQAFNLCSDLWIQIRKAFKNCVNELI